MGKLRAGGRTLRLVPLRRRSSSDSRGGLPCELPAGRRSSPARQPSSATDQPFQAACSSLAIRVGCPTGRYLPSPRPATIKGALLGILGPYRNVSVATKMLHLKRPALFPVLDRLVVEAVKGQVSSTASSSTRANQSLTVIEHLRGQILANADEFLEIQTGSTRRRHRPLAPRRRHVGVTRRARRAPQLLVA